MAKIKKGNVWWAYFTKRVYEEDGTPSLYPNGKIRFKQTWHRLSTDAEEADIAYGKLLQFRRMEKDGIATGNADFQTWKKSYLDNVRKTHKKRTYNLTRRAFFILGQYAHIKTINQITPNFLRLFRDDYLRGEKKYGAVLANRTIRVFTTAMHDAERRKLIYKQEWRDIGPRLKEPTRAKSNLTKKQIKRLLLWRPNPENNFYSRRRFWTCFTAFCGFTGARRSECSGALKTDVDTDNWIVHIQGHKKNLKKGIMDDFDVKDEEARSIPLHKRLRPYIMWLLRENPHSTYLFSDENGKPINPDFWTSHFKEFAAEAGVDSATPHRLRHTFGTLLGNSQAGSKTILMLMGHSDLKTAFGYMGNGEKEEAIKKIKI